ncbi:CPBP family intramembrane glutamic endopeptidase [Mucilaginibacter gossypiicola]|uniref:CPBP family intramembrane glutamic endopeptidase n=1 Tax=Mucilaginibacter gossypiicola TaxID=551995 RepID=UPI00142F56D2|nr:type II CAAX endopeptidase family protein [Mucilaginibacter gossypiicola]
MYTLLMVILFCVFCAAVLIICSILFKGISKPLEDILMAGIASVLVFLITIPFSKWEKLSLSNIGVIPFKRSFFKVVLGLIIGLLISGLHITTVVFFSHISLNRFNGTSFTTTIAMLLLYLLTALREELAFRGYPLRSLAYSIGNWKAQAIIAVFFALEHLAGGYTWGQAILGAAIGAILFGIAALRSGGIALPLGIHTAWNFSQWYVGFKLEKGMYDAIVPEAFQSSNQMVIQVSYIVIMLGAIAAFYFYKSPQHTV